MPRDVRARQAFLLTDPRHLAGRQLDPSEAAARAHPQPSLPILVQRRHEAVRRERVARRRRRRRRAAADDSRVRGPLQSARTTSPRSDPIQSRCGAGEIDESVEIVPAIGTSKRSTRTRTGAAGVARATRISAFPRRSTRRRGALRIAAIGRSPSSMGRAAPGRAPPRGPTAPSSTTSPRDVPTRMRPSRDPMAVGRPAGKRRPRSGTGRFADRRRRQSRSATPATGCRRGVSVIAVTSSAGSESGTRARCLNVRNACACGSSRLTPPFQLPTQRLPIASS